MDTKSLRIKSALRAVMVMLMMGIVGVMNIRAQESVPTGAINGRFSVSVGQKVYFSQGNLQYQASTNTWRFATNQYAYVGNANSNISSSYSGWIDLFGWGTSGWNSGNTYYHPWDSNTSSGSPYGPPGQYNLTGSYANADWGVYNPISNGGNTANQWRTLTYAEWQYVLYTRVTTSGIRYAKANVNNINGVILLPDDWSSTIFNLSNTNSSGANFSSNTISASQWTTLESAGAVFLPAAGYRNGTSVYNVGSYGYYWSASCGNSYGAYGVYFYDSLLNTGNVGNRGSGRSVRLVRVAENYSYGINAVPSPAEGGTVIGSGVYDEGETCTLTAIANQGYEFLNWTKDGQVVSYQTEYSFTVTEDADYIAYFSEIYQIHDWDSNLVFTVNEDKTTVTLTGHMYAYDPYCSDCPDVAMVIPSTVTHNGHVYTVTAIGSDVFFRFSNLVSITIPNTVTTIGSGAFYECTGIKTITIPSSVTTIDSYALAYCSGLKNIVVLATTPPSGSGVYGVSQNIAVLVPAGSLDNYSLSYDWRMFTDIREDGIINFADDYVKALCVENWDTDGDGELYMSESFAVTDLNNHYAGSVPVFEHQNISSFDELQFFMGLDAIEKFAFSNCTNLTSITVPNSVNVIKRCAFYNCSGLTSITVLADTPPSLDDTSFTGVDMSIPCYVPCGSYEAYQAAECWSDFTNMIEGYRNISVSAYPAGSGIVSGSGYSCDGMSVTVTAAANEGYTFENWTENGEIVAITASYSFIVNESRNLVANFSDASGSGRLNGVFSVNENSQVNFSTGNLQYQASTDTWRFATNQYDYVGYEFNDTITRTYDGWVDLFCWGTSGYNHGAVCYQPWSTSYEPTDYLAYGDYTYSLGDQTGQADWGYNAVINGGNQEGQWRTLTNDEWNYMLTERNTESGILYAKAIVNDVNGLIILPDNWNSAYYTLNGSNNGNTSYNINDVSVSDWTEYLEANGAVFLPAANSGWIQDDFCYNIYGDYWSATPFFSNYPEWLEDNACCMYFNNDRAVFDNANLRDGRNSVRLVQAAQPQQTTQTISLSSGVNWVSFDVNITLNDLKAALMEALPSDDATVTIKSKKKSTRYQNGRWSGSFNELDMAHMYMIIVSDAFDITLEGTRVDLTELTVTISNGANWIAYPYDEGMSIADLFGSFSINNDQIKSKQQTARYNNGRWTGSLRTLEPGQGYIFISEEPNDRIFTFPISPNKGEKR